MGRRYLACLHFLCIVSTALWPYAGVTWLFEGTPWVAFHHGMPFGATASVTAWHRIGELIQTIARKLLHMPVLRYVDDYFTPERHVLAYTLLF